MANRFWVGGGSSTSWSATGNTNWAATSGGANNATVPTTNDTVTFDSNSTGTCVADVDVSLGTGAITISGTYAGTIDNSANHNFSMASFSHTATGARTLNFGSSSTWTITITTSSAAWNDNSATGIVSYTPPGTILFSATATGRRGFALFTSATATYGAITVTNAAASPYQITLPANAFSAASMTFTNCQQIIGTNAVTYTLSGALTVTGSVASPAYIACPIGTNTISVGSASTLTSCFIQNMTKAGAGTITANSSFDGGGNTGITINAPASGVGVIGS